MKFAYRLMLFFLVGILLSCDYSGRNENDHTAWSDAVSEHALKLMDGPKPTTALPYIDSVYAELPEKKRIDEWKMYSLKAHYYANYGSDIEKRGRYIDSMFRVLKGRETRYKYEYTQTLLSKADLLKTQKQFNQALAFYYDGRKFAKENMDLCSMGDFSNAIGIIMLQQGNYRNAVSLLKQSFDEIRTCTNPDFFYDFAQPQAILNSIALSYEWAGSLDSALIYYSQALRFIDSSRAKYPQKAAFVTVARGVVEGNLGGVYAKLGRYQEAETHLLENIRTNDRPGYAIEDAQTAKIKLADLYIRYDHLAKADTLLRQLKRDLDTERGKSIANSDIWRSWYKLKWLYNEKVRNIPQAYVYLKRYHIFRDSLDAANSVLKSADINQIFSERGKEDELSSLQKENEVKSVSMFAAVLFLLMAISFGVFIWYHWRRSQESIDELERINTQKDRALEALENSHRENTRIMRIIAHDLRNPIGSITGMSELLLDDENRSEEDREVLELMRASGQNSLKLVNDLLQVNNTALKDLEKEAMNLAELVEYCASMLQFQAQKKDQTIETVVAPIVAKINYEKMWRVISNLVSNAIKFSPQFATITVVVEQAGPRCKILIKDQGIGIPEEMKDKIFDMFTSAKRPGTSGEESFGLGLSISKQIVDAHGGRLYFEPNEPKGTTFVIDLPMS